ncbi:MAG: hypothetical protein ACRD9L_21120 [Bryobacteraceae bacterium]
MPFGGLLTAGLISAGTGIGSSLIGANASAKAGKILSEKGNLVGQSIDKATGGAIQSGYDALGQANTSLDTGLASANDAVDQGVGAATGVQQGVYDKNLGYVQPYQAGGAQAVTTLSSLLAPGGDFNKTPTMADLQIDPGFDFRLQQGQQALERSAAARGSVLGGGALKSLTRYAQGTASDEYAKAFDRFQTDRTNRYTMLSGLAGFGQTANGQAIQAGENYADSVGGYDVTGAGLKSGNFTGTAGAKANAALQGNEYIGTTGLQGTEAAGNAYMGAANGQASGVVGSANAVAGGLNSVGSTAQNLYLYSLLSKPAAAGGFADAPKGSTSDGYGGTYDKNGYYLGNE